MMNTKPISSSKTPVQTTERTGKRWKAVQIIGGLAIVIGLTMLLSAVVGDTENMGIAYIWGPTIMWMGLPVYLFGRVGGWWSHG